MPGRGEGGNENEKKGTTRKSGSTICGICKWAGPAVSKNSLRSFGVLPLGLAVSRNVSFGFQPLPGLSPEQEEGREVCSTLSF